MPSPNETLIPTLQPAARWVEFDGEWYRKTYSISFTIDDPLADYLTEGQQLGRSPNVFFDEAFYLRRYPDVAAAVRKGAYRSGFDHYCRDGLLTYAPHWLFDPEFYGFAISQRADRGCVHQWLRSFPARRVWRWNNGPSIVRSEILPPRCRMAGEYNEGGRASMRYFVYQIHEQRSDLETSLYFDSAWYCANYASAAQAIAAGEFLCALHHYLCNDSPTAFDPLADFSEADYLNRYPDVADAVTKGIFPNGYMHFLQSGVFELRNPSRHIDLRSYWEHNDAVRRAVRSGIVRDAFAHVLTAGRRMAMHADRRLSRTSPNRKPVRYSRRRPETYCRCTDAGRSISLSPGRRSAA